MPYTPPAAESAPILLGAHNERLEDAKPHVVNALRDLVLQYRQEGIVARRHEIRRIRQARLFWQGLQYAWWNPNDMNWHTPFESKSSDDRELQEMPRYQFVTNFYQGFGLSFIAVLSQDVPSVRFYPQSSQSLQDIAAAKSASDVAQLIEQNNHVEELLTSIGYFLWTDGKLGAYVRYVADGQRFGFHDEQMLEAIEIPLGEDVYTCPQCGKEVPVSGQPSTADSSRQEDSDALWRRIKRVEYSEGGAGYGAARGGNAARGEWPGSNFDCRRSGIEHACLGDRDARVSVSAMADGSASLEIESGVSACGEQD